MKTMLILGDDRIAHKVMDMPEVIQSNSSIILDRSTNYRRMARLIWRGRLSLFLAVKMFFCELLRPGRKSSGTRIDFVIKNNHDLLSLINNEEPDRIILFRAGLVINSKIISLGIPLLNIHCAKIPEYGGLGSIYRALKDKAIKQCATLHQVTTTIDTGRVFDVVPFELNLDKSYCHNEDQAYEAGIRLLIRSINSDIGVD